ncbi:MAG: hypothetical protein AAGI88_25120, partial [Pseudomonadota bacterium]
GSNFAVWTYTVDASFAGLTLVQTPCLSDRHDKLISHCRAMVETMGYVGVGHFEFVKKNDSYFFLDLNMRFGGTTNKALACGHSEGGALAWSYNLAPLPSSKPIVRSATNKRTLLTACFSALANKWTEIDYPSGSAAVRFLKVLSFLFSTRDEIFAWGNLRLIAAFYLFGVVRSLSKHSTQASP